MDLKAQKKLNELNPEQLIEIYKKVFDSESGKVILEDLRNRCHFFTPSYTHSQVPGLTEFNEGMRSVILHIETCLLPKQEKTNEED